MKPDFGFYSLLAVVGSFALFSLVAAFKGVCCRDDFGGQNIAVSPYNHRVLKAKE